MPFTLSPQVDALIAMQVGKLTEQLRKRREEARRAYPFVTVSREFGCQGYPFSESLYKKLNARSPEDTPWTVWDRELITKVSKDTGLHKELIEALSSEHRSQLTQVRDEFFAGRPNDFKVYLAIFQTMYTMAMNGRVILMGHGSAIATKNLPRGMHVRLYGSLQFRIENIMQAHKIPQEEATRLARTREEEREAFVRRYANADVRDPLHYHLMFKNDASTADEMAETMIRFMEVKHLFEPR